MNTSVTDLAPELAATARLITSDLSEAVTAGTLQWADLASYSNLCEAVDALGTYAGMSDEADADRIMDAVVAWLDDHVPASMPVQRPRVSVEPEDVPVPPDGAGERGALLMGMWDMFRKASQGSTPPPTVTPKQRVAKQHEGRKRGALRLKDQGGK